MGMRNPMNNIAEYWEKRVEDEEEEEEVEEDTKRNKTGSHANQNRVNLYYI